MVVVVSGWCVNPFKYFPMVQTRPLSLGIWLRPSRTKMPHPPLHLYFAIFKSTPELEHEIEIFFTSGTSEWVHMHGYIRSGTFHDHERNSEIPLTQMGVCAR